MPTAAWYTVLGVVSVLEPHPGRQSNIKDILDNLKQRPGVYGRLEAEMVAFVQRNRGIDKTNLPLAVAFEPGAMVNQWKNYHAVDNIVIQRSEI